MNRNYQKDWMCSVWKIHFEINYYYYLHYYQNFHSNQKDRQKYSNRTHRQMMSVGFQTVNWRWVYLLYRFFISVLLSPKENIVFVLLLNGDDELVFVLPKEENKEVVVGSCLPKGTKWL
eukprot:UN24142